MLEDEFFLGTKLYDKKFSELCKPIKDYLGLNHIIYVNMDKTGRIFNICTIQKWVERFLEEQYYKLDPLLVHPNNIHNGFAIDSASDHKEFKDKLLYDAVTRFDCCHTFAYIEKTSSGGYFGFCFASPKENFEVTNRVLNESQIVKQLIRELHKNLIIVIKKSLHDNRMDFDRLKGERFFTQKGLVFNTEHKNQLKLRLLKEVGLLTTSGDLTKISLSPQEINCLRLYIITRSIKKTAKELGLAIATVSGYIETIKEKLQCSYKDDLLRKAEILESLGRI